jgi:hypothetical protein
MRFIGEAARVCDSGHRRAILRDQSGGRSDAKTAYLFANSGSEPAANHPRKIDRVHTGAARDIGNGHPWMP